MGDTMSGTEWSFVKYHGLGNDFIMIDHRHTEALMISHQQSAALCDRRRGVGADGVIFALPGSNVWPLCIHRAAVVLILSCRGASIL